MTQLAVDALKQWLRFVVSLMLAATGAWIVTSLPAAPVLASPAAVPTRGFDHVAGSSSAYDYRPDSARPPPAEPTVHGYDTSTNSIDPAALGGRVLRTFSGRDEGFFAPSSSILPKPSVSNTKLGNIVDDLYKGTTNPSRVGTGTTAHAVRNELATGLPTGGVFHTQKAQQYSNALQKLLKQDLSYHDRLVAPSLLDDLQRALKGQP